MTSVIEPANDPYRASRALAWFVFVAAVVAPTFVFLRAGIDAYESGRRAGAHLLVAILVVLVVTIGFRRQSPRTRTLAAWGAALAGIVLCWASVSKVLSGTDVELEIAAARPAIARMQKTAMAELQRINSGSAEAASPDVFLLLERPAESAPMFSDTKRPLRERLQELARRNSLASINWTRGLHSRLEGADDAHVLEPARLVDPQARLESRVGLQLHREALDWFRSQAPVHLARYEADIKSLELPAENEAKMLSGARAGNDRATPQLDALLKREKTVISAKEDAVAFVESRGNSVHLGKNGLVFDAPEDAAAFQQKLQAIADLSGTAGARN